MRLVLVHGSGHGAWAWERLAPLLAAAGHEPVVLDLPGRAGDGRAHAGLTLRHFGRAVLAAAGESAVLVAHSAGGFAAEMAAALDSGRVAGIVHVCAYLPRRGDSIAGLRRAQAAQPLKGVIRVSVDGASYAFDAAGAAAAFYSDLDPETAAGAAARLVPEAVAPQAEPFPLTPAVLPRHYVLCTRDRTIPPAFQERMVADWPESAVTRLPASHSPFLSMPDRLAAVIAAAVAVWG